MNKKIPRSKYLRLVTLQTRLESVTKDFQSLTNSQIPVYLVVYKLEECCRLINDVIEYARSKV